MSSRYYNYTGTNHIVFPPLKIYILSYENFINIYLLSKDKREAEGLPDFQPLTPNTRYKWNVWIFLTELRLLSWKKMPCIKILFTILTRVRKVSLNQWLYVILNFCLFLEPSTPRGVNLPSSARNHGPKLTSRTYSVPSNPCELCWYKNKMWS